MERYTVKFMLLQDDGYWTERIETFQARGKNSHIKASAQCKTKYGANNVQIKSVCYQ